MRVFLILLAALLVAVPTTAGAQVFNQEVDGWGITGDYADDGEGICIMEATFQSNTTMTVMIGSSDRDTFLFRISNPAWQSIRQGQSYRAQVTFDREDSYSSSASGSIVDDLDPGITFLVSLSQSTFMGAFGLSQGMVVEIDGRRIDGFNLRGTREATRTLARCVAQLGNRSNYDPFSRGQQPSQPTTRRRQSI